MMQNGPAPPIGRTFVAGWTSPAGRSPTRVGSAWIAAAISVPFRHVSDGARIGAVTSIPQGMTSWCFAARLVSSSTVIADFRFVMPVTTASGNEAGRGLAPGVALGSSVGARVGAGVGAIATCVGAGVGAGFRQPATRIAARPSPRLRNGRAACTAAMVADHPG